MKKENKNILFGNIPLEFHHQQTSEKNENLKETCLKTENIY